MWKKLLSALMVLSMLLGLSAMAYAAQPALSGAECIAPADGQIMVTAQDELADEVTNALHGQQPTNQNTAEENSSILTLLDDLLPLTLEEAAQILDIKAELASHIDIDEAIMVTGGSLRVEAPNADKFTAAMDVSDLRPVDKAVVILIPYEEDLPVQIADAKISGIRIQFSFEPADELYTMIIAKTLPDPAPSKTTVEVPAPAPSVQGSTISKVVWRTPVKDEWIYLSPVEEIVEQVERAKSGKKPTNRNTVQENEDILALLTELMPQTTAEAAQTYGADSRLESMLTAGHTMDDTAMVTGGSLRVSEGLIGERTTIGMKVAGIADGDWAAILMIPYQNGYGTQMQPTVISAGETGFSFIPDTELYTIIVIKDIAAVGQADGYAITDSYNK